MKVSECVVCHESSGYAFIPNFPDLKTVAHAVHNSHHMPTGEWEQFGITVTYPTYMTNCEVCHDSTTSLAAANSMTVSGEGCLSCHGSMESWEEAFEETGTTFHLAYDNATECDSCHNATAGAAAPGLVDVRDFHDGLETERIGIIYGGQDLSVVEGKKFNWTITKVVDDATAGTLAISWTAEYPKGTPIDPCNTTATATAPVFAPYGPNTAGEGGLSMLRSYAVGDDYVAGTASAPGQASAVNLTTTNTKCVDKVATTTITRDAKPAGTRAIVALQGKPQVLVPAGMTTEHWPHPLMFVRVPTPTYQFAVGTGTAVTPRRAIADTSACLKCHVGSLYQHGNTRVDNVTMCIICHNSASSDQNNRVAMGVTASEAYDGKVGMTYEFKTLLHKLHKAGRAGSETTLIYRTRGIYAWAPEGTVPANWAVEPCEKTTPTSTQEYRVFGSDPALDVGCQVHNLYHPTYPRPENDCLACHVKGFDQVPDQEKAVATTLDTGPAPFSNQIDDVLQGAGAAGCTSCHQDGAAKGHAYQNGWVPTTFENGRQTIIDEANK
jgi:OmcA/MtrC family decaheme c-type cytochrome